MTSTTDGQSQVVELRLQNSLGTSINVYLEPWGEMLSIAPALTYRIVARGPRGDSLQVEVVEGGVAVYGWPGSVVSILHNVHLILECSVPVPPTPI